MGSKPSKTKRLAPVKTKSVTIPRIPQDIVEEILNHLAADEDFQSLQACALVSKSWVQSCQRHLFHIISFHSVHVYKWFKTFPVPEESPARHVRNLNVWIGGYRRVDGGFFEYTPWFTNADSLLLVGHMGPPSSLRPSLWKLPRSITSLAIESSVVTLVQIRDIMAQLPNLDHLTLWGALVTVDRRELSGIGAVVRGRFGGILRMADEYVDEDFVNMLLEIPSGLRFTEVWIHCIRKGLPSAVRLAEACRETVVKLTHSVTNYSKSHPLSRSNEVLMLIRILRVDDRETVERSPDLSRFPNLQEVNFVFHGDWMGRCLPWIFLALSTLRPTTSPHLSALGLDFSSVDSSTEALIKNMGDELRRIADEVARIEREFDGAVNLTVVRDLTFMVVLDSLDVSFDSPSGWSLAVMLIYFRLSLSDPSGPQSLKWGVTSPVYPFPLVTLRCQIPRSPTLLIGLPGRRFQSLDPAGPYSITGWGNPDRNLHSHCSI